MLVNADSSKKFVSWYIKSLCSVFIIIVFVFFYRFGFNFNTTLETWVHSASFFNNILTPPLLAITSVFILLTWRTSKTELEATKTLLEKQLASKDLVEDLETFSRRLSDLSNVERLSLNPGAKSRLKFYLVSTLDMNNNLYSHAAQWMEGLADSLDKREFTLYYLSQVDLEVRKCIESYSRLMEHDMTLPEVISEWFSHPDVINLVAGFAFIKSSEGQIWVSSFSKLLKNLYFLLFILSFLNLFVKKLTEYNIFSYASVLMFLKMLHMPLQLPPQMQMAPVRHSLLPAEWTRHFSALISTQAY